MRDGRAQYVDYSVYPGRRRVGVDAYGLAHHRAGDWTETVRHAAVVDAGDDGTGTGASHETAGRDRHDVRYEPPDGRGEHAGAEYLRTVGDCLGPVAALGFQPVEGGDPDRWEWASPCARRRVEAFGEDDGPAGADGSGAGA